MIYRLWRLARLLTSRAPLGVCYAGADIVASVAWLFMPVQRRNAVANMARVVGRRRARRVARRSFQNYARYAVDFIRQSSATDAELLGSVEYDDWQRLDGILARGRGCIVVLMHFGNWDIGAGALALRGYRLNVLAETQPDARFNRDLIETRTRRGVRVIPIEKAVGGIVRAMRRNQILAILLDRPLEQSGVEIQFFGAPTRVPEGPARIALRTGAAIFPVGMVRLRRNSARFRPAFEGALLPERTGDDEHDVRHLTQQIMSAHERIIRAFPAQWYMFRRMWPSDPPASPRA